MNNQETVVNLLLQKQIRLANGDYAISEELEVTLIHGTAEWYNFLKNIKLRGSNSVVIGDVYESKNGDYKLVECPISIQKEVDDSFTNKIEALTGKDLEIAEMKKQMEELKKLVMKNNETDEQKVVRLAKEREVIAAEFEELTGKPPHVSAKVETILENIAKIKAEKE
jgi:patatin-like phospholipase/acyl hydrolase